MCRTYCGLRGGVSPTLLDVVRPPRREVGLPCGVSDRLAGGTLTCSQRSQVFDSENVPLATLNAERRGCPGARVPLRGCEKLGYDPIARPLHVSDCAGRSGFGSSDVGHEPRLLLGDDRLLLHRAGLGDERRRLDGAGSPPRQARAPPRRTARPRRRAPRPRRAAPRRGAQRRRGLLHHRLLPVNGLLGHHGRLLGDDGGLLGDGRSCGLVGHDGLVGDDGGLFGDGRGLARRARRRRRGLFGDGRGLADRLVGDDRASSATGGSTGASSDDRRRARRRRRGPPRRPGRAL